MKHSAGTTSRRLAGAGRRGRIASLFVASLLAVTGVGSIGQTAADASRKAVDVGQIHGDGWRYVAYQRPDRNPVVFDTWKGLTRTIQGARQCRPIDVGGRRVLLECPEGKDRPGYTYRAKTASVLGGKAIPLAKSRYMGSAIEIGRYWVSHSRNCPPPSCYKGPGLYFVNWRTGQAKSFDRDRNWDLDRKALPPGSGPPFRIDVTFDPLKDMYLTECHNGDVVVSDTIRELRLWVSPTSSLLIGSGGFYDFGCDPYDPVQIGSGRVTWSRGKVVNAISYRSFRRFKHRFRHRGASITPVRDGVVVSARTSDKGRRSSIRMIRLRG